VVQTIGLALRRLAPADSRLGRGTLWLRSHAWIMVWWASGRLVVVATILLVETLVRHGELRAARHAYVFGLLGAAKGDARDTATPRFT